MLSENMRYDNNKWSYLEQWMEDCYWDEVSAFDDILEYRVWDMPKLSKMMSSRLVWE